MENESNCPYGYNRRKTPKTVDKIAFFQELCIRTCTETQLKDCQNYNQSLEQQLEILKQAEIIAHKCK